ncbi:hypothetical protein NQ318_022851 [Aromia moschata]|uniref:Peptidase S1 domain-containing protein n=1 Tax=Aromia moschata TaxID=1265417 RepID=A0AAV8XVD0_9CUCU|nr:hypothetical protein NQ318_022851 [Aromia moschata]
MCLFVILLFTDTSASTTSRSPGDVSKEKCTKYAEYVYDTVESPVLLEGSDDVKVYDCAIEREELIVGGTNAKWKEFPHMALLGYEMDDETEWACGGSLISEDYVLTAAHCIKGDLGEPSSVRLGVLDTSNPDEGQTIAVGEVLPHPEYNNNRHYHDIGLVKLEESALLSTAVRPACLRIQERISESKAIASGWGHTFQGGPDSKHLLKVTLDFVSFDDCNKYYKDESFLKNGISNNTIICAGSLTNVEKDTCQGDSGGPLQVYHDDSDGNKCMYDIVGIISFGKACGSSHAAVYTRVSGYLKWIEDTVWP